MMKEMKMKSYNIIFLVLSIFIVSCSAGGGNYSSYGTASPLLASTESYSRSSSDLASSSSEPIDDPININADRKIIYSADISIDAKDPEETGKKIIEHFKNYTGYMQSAKYNKDNTNLSFYIVNSDLERFIESLNQFGEIYRKQIFTFDVTRQYKDLEIELDNAEKMRDRMLKLLDKAETVETALKVERELERLKTKIEILKGRLKELSHKTTYSNIDIRIEDRAKPGPLGYIFYYTFKGIRWLFVR